MKFEQLAELNTNILALKPFGNSLLPVINELRSSQKYLIISSDPSMDTDKTKDIYQKHSGFEERTIALFLLGDDSIKTVNKLRSDYKSYKELFLNNFYWTHFSKTYAKGNPSSFWAKRYLKEEIELFEPQLVIIFGSKPIDFLLGKENFKNRVGRLLYYQGIPIICSLHPSRNWNLFRRGEYQFDETWDLIRSTIVYNKREQELLSRLQSQL